MSTHFASRLASLRRHGVRFRHVRPGTPPGSLTQVVDEERAGELPARASLLRYSGAGVLAEHDDLAVADFLAPALTADDVSWLHLQGAPTAEQLGAIGAAFGLHPLAIEDVFHREARAKVETFEAGLFVVLDHVHAGSNDEFCAHQVSFFVGRNFVISINQGTDELFEPVRERIRGQGRICSRGADYLLYALLDVVVDTAFALLEGLGDRIEALEDEILANPTQDARNRIHFVRRELVLMRRAWWPQREVIAALMRDQEQFFSKETHLYLRDCYDHCVIVIDFVETYREMSSSLLDTYLSAVSQRMNDIMKALTVIATIFLPLTFITGLYGMNFDTGSPWNMPELHWRYGYLYVLGLMVVIVVGMLAWFRRKRWF